MSVISGKIGIVERARVRCSTLNGWGSSLHSANLFQGISFSSAGKASEDAAFVSDVTRQRVEHKTVESFPETSQSFNGFIWSPAPGLTGARREPRADWHVGQFWKCRKVGWINCTLFHRATIVQHLSADPQLLLHPYTQHCIKNDLKKTQSHTNHRPS